MTGEKTHAGAKSKMASCSININVTISYVLNISTVWYLPSLLVIILQIHSIILFLTFSLYEPLTSMWQEWVLRFFFYLTHLQLQNHCHLSYHNPEHPARSQPKASLAAASTPDPLDKEITLPNETFRRFRKKLNTKITHTNAQYNYLKQLKLNN